MIDKYKFKESQPPKHRKPFQIDEELKKVAKEAKEAIEADEQHEEGAKDARGI